MDIVDLSKVMLFNGIGEKDISNIIDCLGGTIRHYKKGSYIISEGEISSTIGIMMSGAAQIIRTDIDGNDNVISQICVYDIFGDAYACTNSIFPLSVFVVVDCTVMHININKIVSPCSNGCEWHKTLIKNMMFLLAQKNIQLNEKINILSKKSIRQRILYYLDYLQKNSIKNNKNATNSITIPFNRDELANFLCVDRSALSRELANMKKENIIDYHKNVFRLY